MPITRNEVKKRAVAFAKEWAHESSETGEAKSFWDAFFRVFGIKRHGLVVFERTVKGESGTPNFIDVYWPGYLIAEHKSAGRDLGKAQSQAMGYLRALHHEATRKGEEPNLPRYVAVSDFARFALHDLHGEHASLEFPLEDLWKHARAFDFLVGRVPPPREPEVDANLKATRLLAGLHDALEDGGYPPQDLERLLVRILFCLFAEDTGLFDQPDVFKDYLTRNTTFHGADLGPALSRFFSVLDTPPERRQKNLDEDLTGLPYVNGGLFRGRLEFAEFDSAMRDELLRCCAFRWSSISPAIFGSLFQGVMQPRERRDLGAHYTNERDILRLAGPLALDALRAELDAANTRPKQEAFLEKLGELNFFDPACGCGNFLVIVYRELRKMEAEALWLLHGSDEVQGRLDFDLRAAKRVNVGQMHGIEIEEWPCRIAEVAMWLVDHQQNIELSQSFGQLIADLPLVTSAQIVHGNALELEWAEVLAPERCSHLLGNPPFRGGKYQTKEQKADFARVTEGIKGAGLLDFVAAWHLKAADYLGEAVEGGSNPRAALVSTNSITQGEQAGVLWPELFRRGATIDFAHRTFPWESEARGKAHVHCVIVGFGVGESGRPKRIFDYDRRGEPLGEVEVKNISPYLTDGPDTAVSNRSQPVCDVPEIGIGNKPIDGGHYLFTPEKKAAFLEKEPAAEPHFRRWYGAQEFLQGIERWCLWLGDVPPQELRAMPHALERVEAVRRVRLESKSPGTQKLAKTPTRFHVENIPTEPFMVIPEVSSERRDYIPIGFMQPDCLASNKLRVFPNATLYHFGILQSAMHMAWVNQVSGRLKSDYQWSVKLVYNNFPWPDPADAQRLRVNEAAQAVLTARSAHTQSGATLADLYDPRTTPPDLATAHTHLDRAVDRCYRKQPFPDERRRFEWLLDNNRDATQPLTA